MGATVLTVGILIETFLPLIARRRVGPSQRSMQIEVHQLSQFNNARLASETSKIADSLSRMRDDDDVAWQLRNAICLTPQPRGKQIFRAWP